MGCDTDLQISAIARVTVKVRRETIGHPQTMTTGPARHPKAICCNCAFYSQPKCQAEPDLSDSYLQHWRARTSISQCQTEQPSDGRQDGDDGETDGKVDAQCEIPLQFLDDTCLILAVISL